MKEKIVIRKANVKDANEIRKLVNSFASEGKMLPLSMNLVYERLRDFTVIEKKGKIIGCGALRITWKTLGEIRSVAISKNFQKKGYGKKLIEILFKEAEELGLEKIAKSKLPHKIWLDCINCPKFPRCDEIAMMKKLKK